MQKLLFFLTICMCANSYAIFCPTNYTTIQLGESLKSVLQICGTPDQQSSFQNPDTLPQEWVYYIKDQFPGQNTVKMNVLISEQKVSNIEIIDSSQKTAKEDCNSLTQSGANPQLIQAACNSNTTPENQNVSSTTICGVPIRIGDNPQTVENACGKPALVNQQNQNIPSMNVPPVTMLTYNGPPQTTLIFKNGHLQESRVS